MDEYKICKIGNSKFWYLHDDHHRVDGPAIEFHDGSTEWWVNGECHREDGPACEYTDGTKKWFVNGKRHREDGPAIVYANGKKAWWINGVEIPEYKFMKKAKTKKFTAAEIASLKSYGIEIKG
jgi:hypothetical protein